MWSSGIIAWLKLGLLSLVTNLLKHWFGSLASIKIPKDLNGKSRDLCGLVKRCSFCNINGKVMASIKSSSTYYIYIYISIILIQFHCSFQLKWTIVAVKQPKLLFLFTQIIIITIDWLLFLIIIFIIYFIFLQLLLTSNTYILVFASHNQLYGFSNVINLLISTPGMQILMYAFVNTIS